MSVLLRQRDDIDQRFMEDRPAAAVGTLLRGQLVDRTALFVGRPVESFGDQQSGPGISADPSAAYDRTTQIDQADRGVFDDG